MPHRLLWTLCAWYWQCSRWKFLCALFPQLAQLLLTLVLHYAALLEVCDPRTSTILLQLLLLNRTRLLRIPLIPYRVHNIVPIQTRKIRVPRIPALLAGAAVGRNGCAVCRDLWGGRGGGRGEESHCEGLT